jgi:hypothetical protein
MIKMRYAFGMGLVSLMAGCATPQQYWVNPQKTLQETGKDLFDCRQAARSTSQQQIYTALELEAPCMTSKGYRLSDKPPA